MSCLYKIFIVVTAGFGVESFCVLHDVDLCQLVQ